MSKFDWWQHQQDLEDAFRLDCSEEDIKSDKEAKKLFKQLKKQRKHTHKMEKLYQKIVGNDSDVWLDVFDALLGIKY
jgi:hypothetical protein